MVITYTQVLEVSSHSAEEYGIENSAFKLHWQSPAQRSRTGKRRPYKVENKKFLNKIKARRLSKYDIE